MLGYNRLTFLSKLIFLFCLQGRHHPVRYEQDAPGRERVRQCRGHRAARVRRLRRAL